MRRAWVLSIVVATLLSAGCGAPGRVAMPGDIAYVRLTWNWFGASGEAKEIGVPRDIHLKDLKIILKDDDKKAEYPARLTLIGEAMVVLTELAKDENVIKPGDGLSGRFGVISIPENIKDGWYEVVGRFDREGKTVEAYCDAILVIDCEAKSREALPKPKDFEELKKMMQEAESAKGAKVR